VGVTIKNLLLVTRPPPEESQADTILQHARMYVTADETSPTELFLPRRPRSLQAINQMERLACEIHCQNAQRRIFADLCERWSNARAKNYWLPFYRVYSRGQHL